MPTLMTERRNGRVRRCDAKCYDSRNASSDKCSCVCGGANHGVRLFTAAKNTLALKGDKYWREKHNHVEFSDLQMALALDEAQS